MAGNNSIQFLRGTSSQRASCTETSLAGQPIYETDTSKLYVGDGETSVNDLDAVKASAADEAETADNVKDQNKGAGIKIWIGTQAEFEDLPETDEDTIYYITDIVSPLDNISTAVGQIVTQGWHTIVELPRLNGASGLVVVKKLYQSNEPISVVFAYSQTGYGKPVITLLSCQMPAAFTGYKIGADTSNTKIQIYLPTTVADNEWSIAVFNAQNGGAIAVASDEVDTDTSTRDTEIELAADIGLATTGKIFQDGSPVFATDPSKLTPSTANGWTEITPTGTLPSVGVYLIAIRVRHQPVGGIDGTHFIPTAPAIGVFTPVTTSAIRGFAILYSGATTYNMEYKSDNDDLNKWHMYIEPSEMGAGIALDKIYYKRIA